jgi:radical SAM superfamily enzyme YgiQ (UPF0313 family)
VAQHLFPKLAKSGCRTVMFGIESGSQRILDRLKKEQTLAEISRAESILGYRPTVTFEEGVVRTARYFTEESKKPAKTREVS